MFFVLLLPVGVLLVMIGLNGRRVGDHFQCRKCDFNLTGLPEDEASCPECGADILLPNARIRGQHVRRRNFIIAGLVVSFVGVCPVVHEMSGLRGYKLVPNRVLAALTDVPTARFELARRIGTGRMSGPLATQTIERALTVPSGDTSHLEDASWDIIIREAANARQFTAAQLQRYVEQYGSLSLQSRPQLQVGRKLIAHIVPTWGSWGTMTNIAVTLEGIQLFVNDTEIPLTEEQREKLVEFAWGYTGRADAAEHPIHLPPRRQAGPVTLRLLVRPRYTILLGGTKSTSVTGPIQTLTTTTKIVDHATGIYSAPDAVPLVNRAANAWVWLEEDTRLNDVCLCFCPSQPDDVHEPTLWLRLDGQWLNAAPFISRSKWDRDSFLPYRQVNISRNRLRKQFPLLTHVDLLVRPNVLAAETDPDALPLVPRWLGQFLFRNVPLDAPMSIHQPGRSSNPTGTLVPAEAQTLTLEQAEAPPTDVP